MHEFAASGARDQPAIGWVYGAWLPVALAVLGFGAQSSYVWGPVDLVLFLLAAILIWRQTLTGKGPVWHQLYWPMAAWFVLVTCQWLWHWSVYPGITLTGLVQLGGCGAAFFLALEVAKSRAGFHRLAWLLWAFCGLLAMEALLQFFGANGYIYWVRNATYGSPVGPYVYHNHFAGCMELLIAPAVAMALRPERSLETVWLRWLRRGLFPALGVAALVISFSRGGMIAFAFEAALAVVLFFPELKRRRRAWWLVLLTAFLLLGFGALANLEPILSRFASLSAHSVTLQSRFQVALACLDIFRHHPWVGSGFGTFAYVYPAFKRFDNGLLWLNAHNDYAQMLAETGVIGALCTLAFLLVLGRSLWQRWRRQAHTTASLERRYVQLAAYVAAAGFLLHSYGDFEFHAPANALLFFLICALAVAPEIERPVRTLSRAAGRRA